jgi:hypothetical protein
MLFLMHMRLFMVKGLPQLLHQHEVVEDKCQPIHHAIRRVAHGPLPLILSLPMGAVPVQAPALLTARQIPWPSISL